MRKDKRHMASTLPDAEMEGKAAEVRGEEMKVRKRRNSSKRGVERERNEEREGENK